ncbi:MAG: hypothetical protein LBR78_02535 [Holosporales bacterium]|jgi:tRNA A37 threonylcarbamoyladenosine modification protein TsaB|nr:hypothetical protein [Holosporales bacterium]
MTLSYFLRGNELHILAGEISKIYHIENANDIADVTPALIYNTIVQNQSQDVRKIIYPIGPGSFTATRTISSIATGFSIANPTIEIIGVSSFLAYVSVASKTSLHYAIAIPTMRGDFFIYETSKGSLGDYKIASAANITQRNLAVFYPASEIFTNINLAATQISAYNTQRSDAKCFT